MTGLVRRATLITAVGVMAASAALAGVPSSGTSTQPGGIILGGTNGGVVDPFVEATYTIRDGSSNLVPNSVIIINFSGCVQPNDLRLCNNQPYVSFSQTLNCGAKTVSATTNGTGVAKFRIRGGAANNGGNPAGVGVNCATVTVDGVPFSNLTVSAPDENNDGLVNLLDTAAYFDDRNGAYRGRSDFDAAYGVINLLDTAKYFDIRNGGGAALPACPGTCP